MVEDSDPRRVLLSAYIACIDRVILLPIDDLDAIRRDSNLVLAEMAELDPWIFKSKTVTAGAQQAAQARPLVGDWLTSLGMKFSEADRVLAKLPVLKEHAGAPPKSRTHILDAVHQKRLKNLNHYQLTTLYCNCGRARHDQRCAERLRKAMTPLEKLLARYAS